MVNGILGKKLGMSRLFREDGEAVPVTLLQAGPCVVVQRKTAATDGYEAVQLGLVEARAVRHATKPRQGHFAKAGIAPARFVREIRLRGQGEDAKPGDSVQVDIFKPNERVHITGLSKGRGFAGFVKRHNFRGGAASHGSMFHRAPGSIGASAYPSRVWRGTRMAGHMGVERVTVRNLEVVRVDAEKNLLVVKGAVPGPNGSYLMIRKASPR
ncbi:MAG: 50S ribosomal protein L3 [Acidobacteria bacterium]|nr:50S ribosomal protein L3 [Acidobacteriota bacterium]